MWGRSTHVSSSMDTWRSYGWACRIKPHPSPVFRLGTKFLRDAVVKQWWASRRERFRSQERALVGANSNVTVNQRKKDTVVGLKWLNRLIQGEWVTLQRLSIKRDVSNCVSNCNHWLLFTPSVARCQSIKNPPFLLLQNTTCSSVSILKPHRLTFSLDDPWTNIVMMKKKEFSIKSFRSEEAIVAEAMSPLARHKQLKFSLLLLPACCGQPSWNPLQ